MTFDFTLDKYGELCKALLVRGYKPMTICSYLSEKPSNENICILRHDVDRKPKNAMKMAELESRMGIYSTYYFRYPHTFIPDLIRRISRLNHEVGYHYETLSKMQGNHDKAIRLFEQELSNFRQISKCKVTTICMHGSPLSRYDNRDLWTNYDFRRYSIVGDAYLSMTGSSVRYFTDTGRNWAGKHSLRDVMPTLKANLPTIEITDDLIAWIGSSREKCIYLAVHPERWALCEGERIVGCFKDNVVNAGKKILKVVR